MIQEYSHKIINLQSNKLICLLSFQDGLLISDINNEADTNARPEDKLE